MCLLYNMYLYVCSETNETVSISGDYKLCTNGESKYSFLAKYAKRDTTAMLNDMSLHQYLHVKKNSGFSSESNSQKCIIPHYVSARSVPTYLPTEGYAKSVLILHVP